MTAGAELLVLIPQRTARLDYIFDWMFDRLHGRLVFTTDPSYFQAAQGPKVQYGQQPVDETALYWPSHGLLFEPDIRIQALDSSAESRILAQKAHDSSHFQDPF